jgi:hypothetical protein
MHIFQEQALQGRAFLHRFAQFNCAYALPLTGGLHVSGMRRAVIAEDDRQNCRTNSGQLMNLPSPILFETQHCRTGGVLDLQQALLGPDKPLGPAMPPTL